MTTLSVGAGQQFSTISDAVAAAQTGDTILIQAGTYTNDFPRYINGLTLEGVGGPVNIVATDQPGNGKAILDVGGNTTLKNLNISGVTVGDGNGAAIRYENGNLTVENCIIHDNQDGLLGGIDPNGTITVNRSEFYSNGTDVGNTHNIYVGDISQFTVTNSYFHDANVGHEIKSRAENTTITNTRIFDNTSTSSYSVDVPNGGNLTLTGNIIEQGPNGQNPTIIAYGEEGGAYTPNGAPHAGTSVVMTGNTIVNDMTAHWPKLLWNGGSGAVTGSGNQLWGLNSGQIGDMPASMVSYLGSAPALDTRSPVTSSNPSTATPGSSSGSGPDTLSVTLAEDAYNGDAQANITLDGNLLTPTPITVSALQSTGQAQTFSFLGTFGAGKHTVGVSFLNDAYDGSPSLDRNLFIDGVSLNGQASPDLASGPIEEYAAGTRYVGVSGGTDPSSSATPSTIVVNAAGSSVNGVGAHFKVILDGTKLGDATAGSSTAQGFDFTATLARGQAHDLKIQFDNDLRAGGQDRNLYLKSINIAGQTIAATDPSEVYHATSGPGDIRSSGNMYWNGTAEFSLPAGLFH